ncbi:FKBP-type peptidyl-prolyl cis-trans isomerase [Enterovibrio sp. ZSDZ35]|uniref:Peptidyl-prolyl cis-trans isomerase n=1 Tax=Enterovibrio qingdaonensis TaxID=2899818 RepID=A0ABT5QMD8_9GAMM|nr:FKBP-type peptidyl-prolyl cis-trans isomerase [Enterovibrio sp. ZSDZ35]MDD1782157.1 FKBP-type peptidyl-prolyl cis-trans isomerase [Enterovibrio sp. ZSDZ35]
MKSVFKVSLLAATVAFAVGCQEEAKEETVKVEAPVAVEQTVTFATEDDKAAYAIGASLAQYLKANLEQQEQIGLALDADLVLQGVQDAFADKSKLTDEEAQVTLQALDKRVAEMAQAQASEKAAAAVQAGEDFRADFAKQDGVKTTDSGLMYQVEKMGDGEKPAAEDTVVVHYKGTLTDGTQFDSSYDRNQPATFPLNRVIPGWTEGVQLMPVGSKFKFVIPPELAYGSQDTPAIPANSTLVFDVELLEIKGKPAKADANNG